MGGPKLSGLCTAGAINVASLRAPTHLSSDPLHRVGLRQIFRPKCHTVVATDRLSLVVTRLAARPASR
ncbi:unnamed protein product [Protopolystoma xenopodis]|uniref:Uncharacterized protein n=1 Tax=Protopolystoma xenopodis TaxID=117903 RepID=A0A3S5C9H6_9PLAT|nr:unnamed protein product [Protopolystoma xenopodis]